MKYHEKRDYTSAWIAGITVVLTAMLIAGLSYASKKDNQENANIKPSQLQVSENSYDFGTISMAKGKVRKVFTVKNNTAAAVEVDKLYTSCMCTEAALLIADKTYGPFGMSGSGFIGGIGGSIGPGEEAKVEVVFDPAAHGPAGVGPIAREATLVTNDGKLIFKFKAQVTP